MNIVNRVRFDRQERDLAERVQPAMGVAYPYPEGDKKHRNRDADAYALMHRLIQPGEDWSRPQLDCVLAMLNELREAVVRECDPDRWRTTTKRPTEDRNSAQTWSIFVENRMIDVLVESREVMRSHIDEFLPLIERALSLCSYDPDPDWGKVNV